MGKDLTKPESSTKSLVFSFCQTFVQRYVVNIISQDSCYKYAIGFYLHNMVQCETVYMMVIIYWII